MDCDLSELTQKFLNAVNLLRPASVNAKLGNFSGISLTKRALIVSLFADRKNAVGEWKGMTMSALAHDLQISKPAMTKIVDELEEDGLLARRADKSDRRNIYIVFSENGEKKVGEMMGKMKSMLGVLIQEVGEEDVRKFIQLTERFYQAFSRYADEHREEHAFTL